MGSSLQTLRVLPDRRADRFASRLREFGCDELHACEVSTLQVNLGKRCNQTCRHCHVDAGPQRTEEMSRETVDVVIDVLRRHAIEVLDITGGAPEINLHFRYLAREGAKLCSRVIDRSNLTIFFEPGHEDLPEFMAHHKIEITASLPCYLEKNVDAQRGLGVFEKSILALQKLNRLGYGHEGTGLVLNLVYNPLDASLPPPQGQLEADFKRELGRRYGITFNQLYTITNMPISRFRHDLQRKGLLDSYMNTLEGAFNPATIAGLMCRNLISVGWDGRLYDCDFNQMLEMPLEVGMPTHVRDFDLYLLRSRRIKTAAHCLGCTAGAGSSCNGSISVSDEEP